MAYTLNIILTNGFTDFLGYSRTESGVLEVGALPAIRRNKDIMTRGKISLNNCIHLGMGVLLSKEVSLFHSMIKKTIFIMTILTNWSVSNVL